MKVASVVISSFASFLMGSKTFDRVKGVVERLESKELTGTEKRLVALAEFKTIGLEMANWLANLALELAVAWFRSKSGK